MSDLAYRCSRDPAHRVTSPKPMDTCPAVVRGRPCRGELVQVGGGVARRPRQKAVTR